MIQLTPLAASLPATVPFVGPEAQERASGVTFRARLGANESGFGPSPHVMSAMAAAAPQNYADPENFDLRQALAAHHGTTRDHIVVGEGIDGLLGYLVRLLVEPGVGVVTSLGAYPTFNFHVAGYGGTLYTVPYRDNREDLPALIRKAHETGAKVIYFANPDNPMGSWWTGADITAALTDLPRGCLLLLDEAYVDLAPIEAVPDISFDHPQVIRMRTFSKAYGLAGLRVGYALGPTYLINAFDKVRNHFGMGSLAQAAALAALQDQPYLNTIRAQVAQSKARIAQIAQDNRLVALPSATNFVAVNCGQDGGSARAVLTALVADGVFVRMPSVAPLDRTIRISCGPRADMDVLSEALPKALAFARL